VRSSPIVCSLCDRPLSARCTAAAGRRGRVRRRFQPLLLQGVVCVHVPALLITQCIHNHLPPALLLQVGAVVCGVDPNLSYFKVQYAPMWLRSLCHSDHTVRSSISCSLHCCCRLVLSCAVWMLTSLLFRRSTCACACALYHTVCAALLLHAGTERHESCRQHTLTIPCIHRGTIRCSNMPATQRSNPVPGDVPCRDVAASVSTPPGYEAIPAHDRPTLRHDAPN
jgi:hypothetical protein